MEYNSLFNRSALLLGEESMKLLRDARVIVFGVGGVGSWCVEALVRTGLVNITIVDCDRVCESNVNRQLMATTSTIGSIKVTAMKDRLLDINPDVKVDARYEVYDETTADLFDLDSYDYIIDCIDSLKDKALLIERATSTGKKFFSSMGAALKMDPTKIRVSEFWKVKGCPLARALRQRFKRQHRFPARKFQCVYSEELLENRSDAVSGVEPRANGSLMHITAIYGLTLAGLVVEDIAKRPVSP